MARSILVTACILVFLAVMLGAFAAHALSGMLTTEMKAIFATANQYHFYHALGLLFIGLFMHHYPEIKLMRWSAMIMLSGVIIFSGSLYMLSISGIRWLGMITPIGGTLLLIAWLMAATAVYKIERTT